MKYKLLVILGIAVLVILIAFFAGTGFSANVINSESESDGGLALIDSNLPDDDPGLITQLELSAHNVMEDCWVAYKGKVYDVTDWLPKHPGSAQAILPYCGSATEFEEAFTKKHGTGKAGMLMKVATLMGDFEVEGVLK